jgi:hypothetical protein
MFEIATTCAFAWDNGADPYFPDFIPLLSYSQSLDHGFFRCALTPPKQEVSCERSTPGFGYESIPFTNGMRLSGYSQNEKYFSHYRNRLNQLFAPKEDDPQYIKRKYKKILNHPHSICIHVRYYFAEKPDEPAFRQYDEEYYEKAMALFTDGALFVVISDSMDFAKKPSQQRKVMLFS